MTFCTAVGLGPLAASEGGSLALRSWMPFIMFCIGRGMEGAAWDQTAWTSVEPSKSVDHTIFNQFHSQVHPLDAIIFPRAHIKKYPLKILGHSVASVSVVDSNRQAVVTAVHRAPGPSGIRTASPTFVRMKSNMQENQRRHLPSNSAPSTTIKPHHISSVSLPPPHYPPDAE
jgi:hypothetical protein